MYQLYVTIQKNKTHKNCLCIHLVNRHQPFSTQTVKAVSMTEPLFLFENENSGTFRKSLFSARSMCSYSCISGNQGGEYDDKRMWLEVG